MADKIIPLKTLCDEVRISSREARSRLRWASKDPKTFPELAKAYKPRQPWQWVEGTEIHKEASRAIRTPIANS